MGQIITEVYKHGCDVTKVVTITPNKPIMNAYLHFASNPVTAPATSSKNIIIENSTIDESVMAVTGKQFASADIICCEDGTTNLMIPSVEYNLAGSCSLTEDDLPEECNTCTTDAEMAKSAREKELKVQAGLYKGTLNRTAQIGMKILTTGVLEAHNSSFNFGTSHIEATTALEKYGEASFDVMDFISKKLDSGIYTKVTISGADVRAFKKSIKNCGDNTCTTKGFIPAKTESGASLVEKGVMLIGYHEDTMTPIYAVSAKVKDKVRDETTGKVKQEQIDLLPKGMMIFTNGKPIQHKFGGLQIEKNGISMPRRVKFRQFKEIDKGTQLITGRLQTNLTPYVASFENVKVVGGLS
jgi:hypothetical protein